MEQQISDITKKIASERIGAGDTKRKGFGTEAKRLTTEKNNLVSQKATATSELNQLNRELEKLKRTLSQSILTTENPNKYKIETLSAERANRVLNPVQYAPTQETREIESQIDINKKIVSESLKELRSVNQQIQRLTGNITLTDRDDPLARSSALWSILIKSKNPLAWAMFDSTIILFMALDTFLIITKLSFKAPADEILKNIEEEDVDFFTNMKVKKIFLTEFIEENASRDIVNTAKNISDLIMGLAVEADSHIEKINNLRPEIKEMAIDALKKNLKSAISKIDQCNQRDTSGNTEYPDDDNI